MKGGEGGRGGRDGEGGGFGRKIPNALRLGQPRRTQVPNQQPSNKQ